MLTSLLLLSLSAAPSSGPGIQVLVHRARIQGDVVRRPEIETALLAELDARSLKPKTVEGSLEKCLRHEPGRSPEACAVELLTQGKNVSRGEIGLLLVMGARGDPDAAQLTLLHLDRRKPSQAFMFMHRRDHMGEWFEQAVAPALLSLNVMPPPGPSPIATQLEVEPNPNTWTTSETTVMAVGATEVALGLALSLSLLSRDSGVVGEQGKVSGRFTLGEPKLPFARTFGIPAVPVGVALMVAGGVSAVGTAIFQDKEDAEWWSLILGHVISGAALTATLLLENPNPTSTLF